MSLQADEGQQGALATSFDDSDVVSDASGAAYDDVDGARGDDSSLDGQEEAQEGAFQSNADDSLDMYAEEEEEDDDDDGQWGVFSTHEWNEPYQFLISVLLRGQSVETNSDGDVTAFPMELNFESSTASETAQRLLLYLLAKDGNGPGTDSADVVDFVDLQQSQYVSVLAQTLSLFLRCTLSASRLRQLEYRIERDVGAWLLELLNLDPISVVRWTRDGEECLRMSLQAALLKQYPESRQLGYTAYVRGLPVVYVASSFSQTSLKRVVQTLGLPLKSIHAIGCASEPGCEEAINVRALEAAIQYDVDKGLAPCAVIGVAGSENAGQLEDLGELRAICDRHGLWLHVLGDAGVPLLGATGRSAGGPTSAVVQATMDGVRLADSVTLSPSVWFGLADDISGVVFKPPLASTVVTSQSNLCTLPLWTHLLQMGAFGIRDAFTRSFDVVFRIAARIAADSSLELLGPIIADEEDEDEDEDGKGKGKAKVAAEGVQLAKTLATSVCFRYKPAADVPEAADAQRFDDYIFWRLRHDCSPAVVMHLDRTVMHGQSCLRFISGAVDDASVDHFVAVLSATAAQCDSVLRARPAYEAALATRPDLVAVRVPEMIGLGAVRYVPKHLQAGDGSQLAEDVVADLNSLNAQLASRLRHDDGGDGSPFFNGLADDGLECVVLGMAEDEPLSDERVVDLLDLVVETAAQLEESATALENLSKAVLSGIKKAEDEVQREREQQFYEEGVLRHLPVVGRMYNWLLPHQVATKGRSFDLQSLDLKDPPVSKPGAPVPAAAVSSPDSVASSAYSASSAGGSQLEIE